MQRGAQARVHVCLSPILEVMDMRLPAIAINTEMQQPPVHVYMYMYVLLAVEIDQSVL